MSVSLFSETSSLIDYHSEICQCRQLLFTIFRIFFQIVSNFQKRVEIASDKNYSGNSHTFNKIETKIFQNTLPDWVKLLKKSVKIASNKNDSYNFYTFYKLETKIFQNIVPDWIQFFQKAVF